MSTVPGCLELETDPGYRKGEEFGLTILELASLRFVLERFGLQFTEGLDDFLLTFVLEDLYFVKLE